MGGEGSGRDHVREFQGAHPGPVRGAVHLCIMLDPTMVNPAEEQERTRSRGLIVIRGVFIVLLVTIVMVTLLRELPLTGSTSTESVKWFVDFWWVGLVIGGVIGGLAILLDALTPRKKLSSMTGILFGLIAGLLATVAISYVIDLLVQTHDIPVIASEAVNRVILSIKAAFAMTLCYLGVATVYSTQDEFRLIIPYVEFAKQMRGTRPLVLDTSAIIDGRINEIGSTGFIHAPVVVPRFVIDELQRLSDSGDRLKRNRGRRGLDIVRKMQSNPHVDLTIADARMQGAPVGVDQMLVELAREHRADLVTTDFNLNKVAAIHGVTVLNINDLANALKPVAIPGERMRVEIIKRGESESQGVGYLDDGTMVVVDHAADRIGSSVDFYVTSTIQTSAGRMIFGDAGREEEGEAEEARDSTHVAEGARPVADSERMDEGQRSDERGTGGSGGVRGAGSRPADGSAGGGSGQGGTAGHGAARGASRRNPRRF